MKAGPNPWALSDKNSDVYNQARWGYFEIKLKLRESGVINKNPSKFDFFFLVDENEHAGRPMNER